MRPNRKVGQSPRAPGFAYSVVAFVLILLLAILTLTARQPPPPTIAEFAPQAQNQITDPSQDFGRAIGRSTGPGKVEPAVATPARVAAVDVPRVRKCVGDPPRQIEDPQSPPCVPYWAGDNGGATSRGVTRDEIIIGRADPAGPTQVDELAALIKFFNRRFEFYGRQMRFVQFLNAGVSPEQETADAVRIDEEIKAFAALPHNAAMGARGGGLFFADELARRKIVNVLSGWGNGPTEPYLADHDPYVWGVQPGLDVQQVNQGEWICKQLAGRMASHADGAEQTRTRRFGVLVNADARAAIHTRTIHASVGSCGIHNMPQASPATGDRQGIANALLQMRQAEVTSIVTITYFSNLVLDVMPIAQSQGYLPEWLLTSYGEQTSDRNKNLGPAAEMANAFGITFYNKTVPRPELPITWALTEIDPNNEFFKGGGTKDPGKANDFWYANSMFYWPMLVLASGLQMAGPRLTPATFAQGLRRARFPNPGAGQPPFYQAHVGFESDHAFWDDAAAVWWNGAAHSRAEEYGGGGAFCYVNGGQRWSPGTWPEDHLSIFEGGCP